MKRKDKLQKRINLFIVECLKKARDGNNSRLFLWEIVRGLQEIPADFRGELVDALEKEYKVKIWKPLGLRFIGEFSEAVLEDWKVQNLSREIRELAGKRGDLIFVRINKSPVTSEDFRAFAHFKEALLKKYRIPKSNKLLRKQILDSYTAQRIAEWIVYGV